MIRYPHIYHAVHHRPWLIQAAAHASICQVLDSRLFGDHPQLSADLVILSEKHEAAAAAVPASETKLEMASRFAPASIDANGIATIRASGVIAKSASAFEKSCFGGVGPQDIQASLEVARDEDRVRGIILAMTSPGGTIDGVPEAAETLAAIQAAGRKPIFVFAEDLTASAAYWISAGATAIYANRTADVGSIGVYMPWADRHMAAAAAGIDVKVFRSGRFKGAGLPGTALTREQEDLLQAEVDKLGTMFRAFVSQYRPAIAAGDMEGQSFLGIDAPARGFTDGVANNLSDVKSKLLAYLR